MLAPFLAAVLAALPATGEPVRVDVSASAQFDGRTIMLAHSPDEGAWLAGEGSVAATLYSRKLVDDDAAPGLQPFLQRAWSLHVDGGGGGGAVRYPFKTINVTAPSSKLIDYRARVDDAHAALTADGYFGRWLYGAASFGVSYQAWKPAPVAIAIGGFSPTGQITPGAAEALDDNELQLPASLALGVRVREVLVTAGWSVTPYRVRDSDFHVRFWGGAFVAARTVVARKLDLSARVDVVDRGALVSAAATLWLRRRIGLTAGVHGGHGGFVDYDAVYDTVGGNLGVSCWLSPALAATLAYAPTWQSPMSFVGFGFFAPSLSTVAHTITLTLTARPTLARR
jgi:hypothetical protein